MTRKPMLAASIALVVAGADTYAFRRWARGKPGAQERERIGYPPLNTLKPVADDIWIVDSGPMRPAGLSVPIRMTVMRLAGGELILHSPTQMIGELTTELRKHGDVRHLVAPTIGHWTHLPDWQKAFLEAKIWAVPGLRNRPQLRWSNLRIDEDLGETAPAAWANEIEQGLVRGGGGFVEAFFFHRASRTLVLADLIQNLETAKLPPVTGLIANLARTTRGATPAHVRTVLRLGGERPKAQVQHILSLRPERVIFAHGSWFEERADERLRQAFGWLN